MLKENRKVAFWVLDGQRAMSVKEVQGHRDQTEIGRQLNRKQPLPVPLKHVFSRGCAYAARKNAIGKSSRHLCTASHRP